MLNDVFWSLILLLLLVSGLSRPHLALAGALFVDVLVPQNLSFAFLAGKPVAMIATLVFAISLVLNIGKYSWPLSKKPTLLILSFMAWITITTWRAEFQYAAWFKYDYAIKTLLIVLFIPFVFDTRKKLEGFLMVFVGAASYYMFLGGLKTLFGQTGYGQLLVYTRGGDSGIAETSTLSMVAIMILPMVYYLYRHGRYARHHRLFKPLLIALACACVLAMVGTHARTGLVGLMVLLGLVLLKARFSVKLALAAVIFAVSLSPLVPDEWMSRMSTIKTAEEDASAFGRVVVWRWTVDYVSERPIFGGGFNSYHANACCLHLYNDTDVAVGYHAESGGKAFHSIYFEVLGEHGYVGLAIFFAMIFQTWYLSFQVARRRRDLGWARTLAIGNTYALFVYCVCGNFIGIAFAPWLYYLLGIATAVHSIAFREAKLSDRPVAARGDPQAVG